MNSNIWVLTLAGAVTLSTTLILASLGALLTERAGVLNLGVEGVLLASAVTAFLASDASGSVWLGLLVGALAGMALAGVHALLAVVLRANQIVSGLALVIFGTGLANFLGKPKEGAIVAVRFTPVRLGALSDLPVAGPVLFGQDVVTYAAVVAAAGASWFLFRTRPGMELRATGDDPATVDAQGLSVATIRIRTTLVGGAFMGTAGAWLMMAQSAGWHQAATTSGVGWIALALVVFAGWRPGRLVFGAVFFGFCLRLPFTLQAERITFIPNAFMDMLPYLATLAVLIAISRPGRAAVSGAPRALGTPFARDER